MRHRWVRVSLIVVVACAVVGSVTVWLGVRSLEPTVPGDDRAASMATAEDLEKVMQKRVFFGHQSVGRNIISGIPELFKGDGADGPTVVELASDSEIPADQGGAAIIHAMVGQNRYPETKLDDFAKFLRAGVGKQVDVAVLKFCYLDVDSTTDVPGLFEQYRSRMAQLSEEFPEVTFVYATVPLRTEATDLKQWVKEVIGRPNDNAARERYNQLIRAEFASTGRLFDIAAIQSTGADGSRAARSHKGVVHYAMVDSYASDPGHLNAAGSVRAASEFLAVVGRVG